MYYVHCAGCPKVKISTYILCKVFTSKHKKYTLCAGCPLSNSCHLQMYNVQHVNLNMYNIHCAKCPIIYIIYICTMYTLYNIHCAGCPIVTTSTYILYKVFTSKYVKYTLCTGSPIVISSTYVQCTVCTSKYVLCTLCRVSNRYIFYLYIMYSVSNRYTIYTYTM